jgi:hypothetical protein
MNFRIGQFGHFVFTTESKFEKRTLINPFDIEGATVIQVNETEILLKGSDDVHYVVSKNRIKMFEEMDKVNK